MGQKKTTLDEYKQVISQAQIKHKRFCEDVTKRNRRFYRGEQRGINGGNVDNIILSNVNTIVPALFSTLPKMKVLSTSLPDAKNGNPFIAEFSMKMLLQHYIKILNFRWQLRRCLFDAQISPMGFMWIGHGIKTEIFDENEMIKEDQPFMVRVDPNDILIDPNATDHLLTSAKWIARRWVKPLEEIKEDKSLKNTKNLRPNTRLDNNINARSGDAKLVGRGKKFKGLDAVEGYDVWDKDENRIISVVAGHDKPLADKPWPLDLDGFPCESIYFIENPGELYPIAPVSVDIPNQEEINWISDLQLENINAAATLKVFYNQARIKDQEVDKMLSAPTNAAIAVEGNVNDIIAQVSAPHLTQDIYLIRRQLKRDNRAVRGLTVFESGGGDGVETAKEAQAISAGVAPRRIDQRNIVEDFIERVMSKLASVIQQTHLPINIRLKDSDFLEAQTLTRDKLVNIERDDGQGGVISIPLPWLNIVKEDLAGDFNYEVEAGTTEALDPGSVRGDAIELYQVMSQNPLTNQSALARQLVETYPSAPRGLLRDAQQVAKEQSDAQQAAIQAEEKKTQSKHQTDLMKTKMKTDTTKQTSQLKADTEIKKEVIKATTISGALG